MKSSAKPTRVFPEGGTARVSRVDFPRADIEGAGSTFAVMTPSELFNPNNFLSTSGLTGPDRAKVLLDAGKGFPGGPIGLVFALVWAPVGPGIPAGVLLARHIPLNPAITCGLYALSDVLAAAICHPLFVGFKALARHVPALKRAGKGMLKLAMLGVPAGHVEARGATSSGPAAPFRVAPIGFGFD